MAKNGYKYAKDTATVLGYIVREEGESISVYTNDGKLVQSFADKKGFNTWVFIQEYLASFEAANRREIQ